MSDYKCKACGFERNLTIHKECPRCGPKSSLAAPSCSAALKPATVFPVGSFIADEMQERGWSIEELTSRTGGDPVTQLTIELLIHAPTKGVRLDKDTAIKLSMAFGTSYLLWLKLDEAWQQNKQLSNLDQLPSNDK